MTIVRVPLAVNASNRAANFNKDALLRNCYAEVKGQESSIIRRFGYTQANTFSAGQSLGLFSYQTQAVSVIGTNARLGTTSIGTVNSASIYQFTLTAATSGFVLKNNAAAYYYNGSTLAQITDANYPATTVPGVAYLDGFTFVMTPAGDVYNSNVTTPTVWGALNKINTLTGDGAIALCRYLNYVVAFGANTTTFFYNANNATGSPLLPNKSATLNVGCANGNSVVQTENTVFWIGQTKQKSRSVYVFNGLSEHVVSTPYIDRILAADDLATVYAYFLEVNGHGFYVLTLKTSNLTIVYDTKTENWQSFTSTGSGTVYVIVYAWYDNGVVYLVIPNHGLPNGTIGVVGGTGPPYYLGTQTVNVLDANTLYFGTPFNPSAVTNLQGGIDNEEIDVTEVNNNI